MMATGIPVETIPAFGRREAVDLATTENQRILELLVSLDERDWTAPTDCPAWDVRALAGHVLGGMEAFASMREFVHQMRAAKKAAGDGPLVDGMTAVQVAERSHLGRDELLARIAAIGPRSAQARGRVPAPMRKASMKQDVGGATEKWRMGYLLDVILTRDVWMHRVDIARATGRELLLTADHDGRIVAEIVAEWARRHGQPFHLHLEGPAGGAYVAGSAGEEITVDAVEFCRILSERSEGTGLLARPVPF